MPPLFVDFIADMSGIWQIEAIRPVIGDTLPPAPYLSLHEATKPSSRAGSAWTLRGVTSNTRYTRKEEVSALAARQEGLNRPAATRAALIPLRKTDSWWALAQDERRAIFEERSRHIQVGLEYLPAVARRLHHSRELGEPFDFVTWFEYAPEHSAAFEDMVGRLRESEEWRYVDREVDVRLSRG